MRKNSRGRLCRIAALTAICAAGAAADPLYSVFCDNRFGTIDSNSGSYAQIGTLIFSAAAGIGEFNNALYAQSMQGELITVNPAAGASTVIGDAGLNTTSEVFAGGANGLFEIDSLSDLYSISPLTGAGSLIGSIGLPANNGGWDTSLSDDGTNLYFTAGGGGAIDELYQINTATGLATDLGSTGVSGIAGSAIAGADLDLFQYNAGTDHIYNAPLGSSSFVAAAVLSTQIVDGGVALSPSAEAFSGATPEPVTFLLLGSGLVAIGLFRRRKDVSKN